MKKNIFVMPIIFVISCLITSCASLMAHAVGMMQEDTAYKIIPQNIGENRAVAVFYSYEYLKAKEDKRAENAMREPKYNGIPKFGYIQIRIQGWTADTANPKDWLFIVQDKNKNEIYRDYGSNSTAHGKINNMGKYYTATYWNLHNIYLKDNYDFPLYLRVVTAFNETAIDIIIEKK
jgi:hypothetical protein